MSITWRDGVTLTAEAALSAATGSYGVWDTGLWDTATWGPDVVWTDVSAYLRAAQTTRRFSRDLQVWEAGTSSWLLSNRDRRFSPTNLSGPYVTGGVTGVRPWRPTRLRATYAGITYPIYQGYALSWKEEWPLGHRDATCVVAQTDEYSRLAGVDGYEQNPIGAGETTGRRVHRILDAAGHTGTRNVDDGRNTCQATTLAANTVTELVLTADSEGGAFYIDADGTATFDSGFALIENTRSNTVQATFGDQAGDILRYASVDDEYDGELLANIAAFARVNGTTQLASDNTSRALYGDRRATRTDLICESDAQVAGLAQLWIARYKDPELRVTRIVIKPRRNPTLLFPQVLGRKVRDLIRVTVHPLGGGTITQDCFIAGISHSISDGDWETTFDLWSGAPFTSFVSSRWNTGVWDTATWFY